MPAAGHHSLIGQTLVKRYHVTAKLGEGGSRECASVFLGGPFGLWPFFVSGR